MKQVLLGLIVIILFASCNPYVNLGNGGCDAWGPRKFEKDRRQANRVKAIHARNRSFRHY